MKLTVRSVCATILVFCLTLFSASALTSTRSFQDAGFFDIPDDAWSLPYISSCYEMGLMLGQEKGRFVPDGTLSLAEGITAAARVHSLWRGDASEFPSGACWYSGAVGYALNAGLFSDGEFPDYEALATRAQLAGLLAKALPESDLSPINNITALPDVSAETPYSDSIFRLYNAGVLTGSDKFGTFSPNAFISRAELAAILCRLVLPETRRQFSLYPPAQEQSSPLLDTAAFDAALANNRFAVVFFFADWCQPCKDFSPTFDDLSEYCSDRAATGRVNVELQPDLAQRYVVFSYPMVIFFQNGQEVHRILGDAPLEFYTEYIESKF